jgi:hypothetical protein
LPVHQGAAALDDVVIRGQTCHKPPAGADDPMLMVALRLLSFFMLEDAIDHTELIRSDFSSERERREDIGWTVRPNH